MGEEKCETEWVKDCNTEYLKKCHTEWVEECWEEDEEICEWLQDCHEPQEHHYSSSSHSNHGSSSHGPSEPAAGSQAGVAVQNNVGTTKRSVEEYEGDLDMLEDIDEKILTEALENIPASELLKLSQEMAEFSKESSDTGVATIGESREKRSLHLFNLHLLGKHLAGKAVGGHFFGKAAKTILGTTAAGKGIAGKTAAGKAIAGTTAAGKAFAGKAIGGKTVAGKAFGGISSSKFSQSSPSSSHSSHSSHHKKCKNVKKCWWKPVKNVRSLQWSLAGRSPTRVVL